MPNIEFYIKHVYGNATMYVVDDKIKAIIKQLTGQITLTPNVKDALEKLGFTFTQVLPQ